MKLMIVFVIVNLVTRFANAFCTTPNGENATCIPIKECEIFLEAVKDGVRPRPSIVDFMQKSSCGFKNGPLVCCGSVNYFQKFTVLTGDAKKHRNFHLLPTNCGIQDADGNIGDTEVQLEEFPWLALIQYRREEENSLVPTGYGCAATLISEQYLLTSAHCVTGRVLKIFGYPWRVRIGDHDLSTKLDCRIKSVENQQFELCNGDYQDIEIERTIYHPDFNWNKQQHHDIALLRLKEPVKISINVRPICLPMNGETTPVGKRLFAAGWGKTESSPRSQVKLKVSLPVVSNEICNTKYKMHDVEIIESQLCAGGEVGVNTCQGDEGGPVMTPKPGSNPPQWYAEGILSFGVIPCGANEYPGVQTRLGSYIGWILENMEE